MKYDIIFYIAKKTGYCEKRLRSALGTLKAEANRVINATTPEELGEQVSRGLRLCPMVVIVGGLRSPDDDNLATVLSRVLSNSTLTLENTRRLTAKSGDAGYIVRCGAQFLLAMPDDPDDIESILSPELLSYIEEKAKAE